MLPSVENTMKDIRNCGLGQGEDHRPLTTHGPVPSR
ncbi:hypothetical protein FQN60_017818 [Etheostoma spectabile]|uniref:Uncharacterized protein n=1 Tax=Etheostoma spectabile TaxID=54343 RepID=A0A5J5DGG4_9PERO|nr:hypothetical protein FQN60_017818 [Etheostoma spectabile]